MTTKSVTLDEARVMSEKLSPPDRLRLISLLSELLRNEMQQSGQPVDLLSLAGLGSELCERTDVAAYLEQERASWECRSRIPPHTTT